MESDQMLKQVEDLLSVIDSLPVSLRGAAIKKIQDRLGPPKKANKRAGAKRKSKNAKENEDDLVEESKEAIEEDFIKLCETDGIKILHCYSEASGETSEVTAAAVKTKIKKSFNKFKIGEKKKGAKSQENVENAANVKKKVGYKKIEDELTPDSPRSKRKRRVPKRFLDDGDVETGNSESIVVKYTSATLKEDGTEGEDVKSDEEQVLEKKEEVDDDDNIPFTIFKIPTGLKPNEILQHNLANKDAGDKNDLRRIRGQRTVYGCTVCNRKFHSRSLVVVHMRVHTGEKPHQCHICDKTFTQRGALNIHIKRHEGKFQFYCDYCSYKSIAKVDMMRHVARHTGEKNYSCEFCGKCFFTDTSLKDHLRHVHERSATFSCELCAFTTHRPDNLKRHMIVKHSNKEYIQCPICHEFIKQRGTFIAHLRTHTGERPHSCRECGKNFKSQSQVAAHLRIHKEGAFICDECGRRFQTRFHLKRHSVIHTGEKPFACMHCEYTCNVKGNINKHVKLVHGVVDFSFRTINGPKPKEPAKLGLESVEAQEIQKKGQDIAEEFLAKVSTRKDENLTVEKLKEAMELKNSEKQKQMGEVRMKGKRNKLAELNGGKKVKTGKNQVSIIKKAVSLGFETEETVAMSYLKEYEIGIEEEEVEKEDQLGETEETEEVVEQEVGEEEGTLTVVMADEDSNGSKNDGTTIIIPPDAYICVQQPDMDGEEIALPMLTDENEDNPTTVYVFHCEES